MLILEAARRILMVLWKTRLEREAKSVGQKQRIFPKKITGSNGNGEKDQE